MMKRLFDIAFSLSVLMVLSPLFVIFMILIWRQDHKSPLYRAPRVGKGGKPFTMVKLRSMVVGADKTGVSSTSATDARITPLGHTIRRYKLDEFTQFWNVLAGDMSVVGPRPQVMDDVNRYTAEERRLLNVKPGVTDFASIVFSDEGRILKDSANPDLAYNQLIRPWKSRLGLLYVDRHSFSVDCKLIVLTAVALVSRSRALRFVEGLLAKLGADDTVRRVVGRREPLTPYPPPGANRIIESL